LEDVVKTWRGRRVFLTGHTGFKGSWLSLWLSKLGSQIRGYSLDPCTEPNLFNLASVGSLVEDVRGDVRDYAKLEGSLTEFKPEVVFHLAAQPIVRRSYADPVGTYATNVMGTVHLLEAIRKTPSVRSVVCVTTDKCYQNQEWIWPYRENDPLGGHDPYASSKACTEIVSAAYRSSFFPIERLKEHQVALATARAGNVIGGGDWSEDRLIPDLIRGFRSGQPVLIRRPDAIRPWQHVLEPLGGYLALAEALVRAPAAAPHAVNFGPDAASFCAVRDVVEGFSARFGGKPGWVQDSSEHPAEARALTLSSVLAERALGWRPRLGIGEALAWTADWYQAFAARENMVSFSQTQIARYETLRGAS